MFRRVSLVVIAAALVGLVWSVPARAENPADAPELPGLLRGYAVRPPWPVAGVDYAVGLPAGTILKDPAAMVLVGVTVNTPTHLVYVTGDNITLNGYDFSLEGGWNVYVEGANDVIENSNFKVGANNLVPISGAASASNLAVLRDTINGGGIGVAGKAVAIWSLISYNGTGLTVEYNSMLNAPQHIIEFKSGTLLDEYNLIRNVGYYVGAHVNDVQFNGGVSNGSVIAFNTVYDPQPTGGFPVGGGEGLQVEAQLGSTITNTEVENNTVIATGPVLTASYLIALRQDAGANILTGVDVRDNYLDASGAYGAFYPTPTGSDLAFVGNINLLTGATIAAPRGYRE